MSFDAARLFKFLPPDGKDRVFRIFFAWAEEARKRGVDYRGMDPDMTDLTEMEADTLTAMIENAAEGFDGYWSRSAPDPEPDETQEQPETASDSLTLRQTAKERRKEGKKEGVKEIVSGPGPYQHQQQTQQAPKKTVNAQRFPQRSYDEKQLQDEYFGDFMRYAEEHAAEAE